MSKLTKQDIKRVQLWSWLFQWFSFNYETMQSPGWTNAIGPAIEKIYAGDEDKIAKKMNEHLSTFYNTQPYMSQMVLGACLSIEESEAEEATDAAIALRTGLMGPFAGLGDALFFVSGKVIFNSIAGYMALNNNFFGEIIALTAALVVAVIRYKFFWIGYNEGAKFITTKRDQIQGFTSAAVVLGLTVVGAMIPATVKFTLIPVFQYGAAKVTISSIMDSILPYLMPLLATAGIYYGLGLKKMTTVKMVWLIIIVTIALTYFKIL